MPSSGRSFLSAGGSTAKLSTSGRVTTGSTEHPTRQHCTDAAAGAVTTTNSAARRNRLPASFLPLILDVAVPVGSYYLLKNGFGMSTMAALGWSSVVPGRADRVERG